MGNGLAYADLAAIRCGRMDEVLAAATDTIAAYRRAAAIPGADLLAIAQQLIHLRPPVAASEAVAPAQAAVDVLGGLTPPVTTTAHLAKLAEAWHLLAVRLRTAERRSEALSAARHARDVYEQLVVVDWTTYQPSLDAVKLLIAAWERE
jgi:hypothetical protein